MTAGLVAFLRARLDEDEAVAQAAGVRTVAWVGGGTWHLEGVEHNAVGGEEAFCHPHNAAHIARYDPARVLAEVEAKRRIVRAHEKWCEGRCEAKYPEGGFDAAHYWSVKSLAAVWDDHPDYRDEWRP